MGEVKEKGGSCEVGMRWEKHHRQRSTALAHTLQSCMEHNSFHDTPKLQNEQLIPIREPQSAACQIESEGETQLFIKKKEKTILGLQRVVDFLKLEEIKLESASDESESDESESDDSAS